MAKKAELLVGIGSFSCAIAAVKNGADAVYFGVKGYNMRDLGTNFSLPELKRLMSYLRENNVNGYLALNTIIFEDELRSVEKVLKKAKEAKVDAVIVHDLGVLNLAKKHKHKVFLSTQASVSNSVALEQYKKLGVKRVILAREVNLAQMMKLAKKAEKLGITIECFVHGAMCISVSGRCFLSHDLFNRSANRGKCLQICRRAFFIDGQKPNYEEKEVYLQGNTILSAKDLKTIQFLDKIIKAGVNSLKIEGRNKPADYVAATTRCYKQAIDAVYEKTFTKEKIADWNNELVKVYNRGFSEGFFFRIPGQDDLVDGQGSKQTQRRLDAGVVKNYYSKLGVAEIKLCRDVSLGDKLVFEGKTTFLKSEISSMQINHRDIKKAKKGQKVAVKVPERVRENDNVFVVKKKKIVISLQPTKCLS